ncbi:GntR family transcriptional regulator [Youhaiella tibetensis]|uniref:GntR family transcriptional regulator n=1 Tax=Paradevosia tibetensis TaxID=1447062 RepID=A0A5B9DTJ6_9HYPH|nr:GntR family transcriptional regulator [Youhaiella tibetensis]QEE22235.1 GntR family transcriptional regulator [Youhaiella tibetensis]GGF44023.1 GntR family transcriptional regulator [Youhaiella tibetensis]
MTAPEDKSETVARPRGSGAQTIYERLRQSILELAIEPGSALDEVGLSEEFGMSRTPVREALVRLAAEGLVTTLPNRNTIVSPIDFTQLPVYFEALTLMYRVTTRSAAIHHTAEDLIAIRSQQAAFSEAVTRRDALGMIGANRDFHVAIAQAGGNPYFSGLFTRLLDEGRRILRLYYSSFDDRLPRQYVDEHEAIVDAIAARDPDLCEELGAVHGAQIVQQIQSYLVRTTASGIRLEDR